VKQVVLQELLPIARTLVIVTQELIWTQIQIDVLTALKLTLDVHLAFTQQLLVQAFAITVRTQQKIHNIQDVLALSNVQLLFLMEFVLNVP